MIAARQRTRRRVAPKRDASKLQERRNLLKGLLFISPWIVGFLAFTVYPILYSLVLSFTRYSGFQSPIWLGWQNYTRLFTDSLIWISLYNTLFYTLLAVPIGIVVAILLAVAMNHSVREVAVYRAALYLPSILPIFALSFIFLALLNPGYGLVSYILAALGLPQINYLSDPNGAKIVIVAMAQLGAGNAALIFLAGLRGIPRTLYEAARIDGAGSIRSFFSIALPLLTPIILYNLIIGLSAGMQVFTQAYIMTAGGPNNATLFYVYYLYNNAFRYAQLGYASAVALVLFVIGLLLAFALFIATKRFVHYELVS
jgi:multiple sugar transport system permease protein